jgi:hypothetical protein
MIRTEASMTGTNQDFGTRWFQNVWNMERREAIAEMLAPDALIHEAGLTVQRPEGFYPFFDRMQKAFSQIRMTVEDTTHVNQPSALRDRETREQLLSPLTLRERLRNRNTAGRTDNLHRLPRTRSGRHEHSDGDQAGSTNALAAMYGNALSRVQLSPDACY